MGQITLQHAEKIADEAVRHELEQLVQSINAGNALSDAWKYLSQAETQVVCPTPTNIFTVDPKSVYKFLRNGPKVDIHFNIFGTITVGASAALTVTMPQGFDVPNVEFFTCQGDDGTVRPCYGYVFPSNYGSQPIGKSVFTVQRFDGVNFALGALAISGQFNIELVGEPSQ